MSNETLNLSDLSFLLKYSFSHGTVNMLPEHYLLDITVPLAYILTYDMRMIRPHDFKSIGIG